ncbi:hypothetical protein DVG80_04120 [Rhodococcus erythropolis]|nr:hypothetical protein DVG80_04120 [Rhodococcus erythropolis]
MSAVTERAVVEGFERVCAAATAVGVDASAWTLHHGSQSNGIAWMVVDRRRVRSFPYMGRTRGDAVSVLAGLEFAFLAVAQAQREAAK